jgi:hypothetical protein
VPIHCIRGRLRSAPRIGRSGRLNANQLRSEQCCGKTRFKLH